MRAQERSQAVTRWLRLSQVPERHGDESDEHERGLLRQLREEQGGAGQEGAADAAVLADPNEQEKRSQPERCGHDVVAEGHTVDGLGERRMHREQQRDCARR